MARALEEPAVARYNAVMKRGGVDPCEFESIG